MLAHPIVSTPDASIFILPYIPPLSSFLCTVKGFTLSICNQSAIQNSEDTITKIIWRTLLNNKTLVALLKAKLLDDGTSQHNLKPAINIILTLKAGLARGEEMVDHVASYKSRKPLWNVFFRSLPPITWTSYFVILQHLWEIHFVDIDCGSAVLVEEEHHMHCFNCKGADHNPIQCEFITLEGWYSHKATDKVEETAEFVTTTCNKRPHREGGNCNK